MLSQLMLFYISLFMFKYKHTGHFPWPSLYHSKCRKTIKSEQKCIINDNVITCTKLTATRNAKRSFRNVDLKMPLIHSFPYLDFNIKHVITKYFIYFLIRVWNTLIRDAFFSPSNILTSFSVNCSYLLKITKCFFLILQCNWTCSS